MEINTTYYLRSYPEFLEECERVLKTDEFQCKNYTAQKHCGWTESLYEVQSGFIAIEYMQNRIWRYHFNGSIGEGLTLDEAVADHKQKYDEAFFSADRH